MRDDANDILSLLAIGLSDKDKGKYEVVKDKFQAYFIKNINVIYEQAKFNRCCQQEGGMVDQFITLLHTLAEHFLYGPLKEEMISLIIWLWDYVMEIYP